MAGHKRKRSEDHQNYPPNILLETRVVVENYWVTPTVEFSSFEAPTLTTLFEKIQEVHPVARKDCIVDDDPFVAPIFYVQESRPNMGSKWFRLRRSQTFMYTSWFKTCITKGMCKADKLKIEVHLRSHQTAIREFNMQQAGQWGQHRYVPSFRGAKDHSKKGIEPKVDKDEMSSGNESSEDDGERRSWYDKMQDDMREAPSTEEWFPELVADVAETTAMPITKPELKPDNKPATKLETHEETEARFVAQEKKADWSICMPIDEEEEQDMITYFEGKIMEAVGDFEKDLSSIQYETWKAQVKAWKKEKKAETS